MRKLKKNSREISIKPILEIASSIGLAEVDLVLYGRYKAIVRLVAIYRLDRR